MRLLVCGARGMLGQDVVSAAERAGHEVLAVGHGELDVTDPVAVQSVIEHHQPDAVVNCAAFTDVDGAESDPDGAMSVNAEGAGYVAAAADRVGAEVLLVSTDYVFAGDKGEPYVESDPVGPLSSYGRSKLAGEERTAQANERHYLVRTAWLFGTGGRNFVDTMLGLARDRDEVRVVADQRGSPTYTAHLADSLLGVLGSGAHGVHHAAASGECTWADLAAATFEEAGVDCRVEPCTSEEFPRPAPRPAYSVLRSERAVAPELPEWREGLRAYLSQRAGA